jgi:16S rRNA (guanine527-N7)-methyltransferase
LRGGSSSLTVSRETLLKSYFLEQQEKIDKYAQILQTWGIERGLIGPKEGDRIWDRHIANCIPLTTLIPINAQLVDIGSGAGLPGIVIALERPDVRVTLIEPLQRRVDFLQEAIAVLDIDVEVIRSRSESVKKSFDIVTARAVAPLPKLLDMSWHLVKPNGALLAMKGEAAQSEIDAVEPKKHSITTLHIIELPNFELSRVVEVKKLIK